MKEGGVIIDQFSNYVFGCSRSAPIRLFRYHIAFRVVDRHIAKRHDLVLHLFPIADNHNRGPISVEVFGGGLLNVRRS